MNLKTLQDWVLTKQLKSVPDVIDVAVFGGTTREYQVNVDPNKLIAYGLNIGQVEQALANNNINAGGSFIERGEQAINVRAVGLVENSQRHRATRAQERRTESRCGCATSEGRSRGRRSGLGQVGKAIHPEPGKVIDNPDVVSGIVLLRKGAAADNVLAALHEKVDFLNHHFLPPGVKIVPHLDRSDLMHLTTHTVLHNLTEGIILVSVILFVFLGNLRGALIVTLTIPFSLLFAAICLDLRNIPANLLSLGALDFGMIVEGAVVMVENIVRLLSHPANPGEEEESVAHKIRRAAREVQRPVFFSIAIIITAYLPIFTLQRVEGRLFRPMAWTVAFALLGALLFSMFLTPVLASLVFPKGTKEWHNPLMELLTRMYTSGAGSGDSLALDHGGRGVGQSGAACCCWREVSARNSCRIWMRARSGLAARWRPAPVPPKGLASRTEARVMFAKFPEVTQVVSQVGRPDDGTDTTGFFNTEYFIDLKPKDQWRPVFHQDKDKLIEALGAGSRAISRRDLEFFAADLRQHGGSGQRREGRTRGEDLRHRSAAAGAKGRRNCRAP